MSGNLDCQIKSITCVDSSYTLEVFLTGIRRKQLTCRRKSLTNFITNTFVVYRVRLATRNGIHYLSPFNVYYISLTGYHILAHIVTDMCYNMFKQTSTFLVFKKMHGIATFYTSNDVLEDIEHAYGINKRYVELHSYPWPNSLNHIFENK